MRVFRRIGTTTGAIVFGSLAVLLRLFIMVHRSEPFENALYFIFSAPLFGAELPFAMRMAAEICVLEKSKVPESYEGLHFLAEHKLHLFFGIVAIFLVIGYHFYLSFRSSPH